jgi:transcriptional regulator with XRE-family HTH domain
MDINTIIGGKIRAFRKGKGLTIEELGKLIYKSKATVSKYEKGEISIDVATLYQIADALNISIDQLIHYREAYGQPLTVESPITSFKNATRYYTYNYDGRNNRLIKSVIDINGELTANGYQTMMYMNVKDYDHYQDCENTYIGYTSHYDTLTSMILKNQSTPIENITINILATFVESERKWGLFSGVSFRPFMPVATKILLCKKPQEIDKAFVQELKVSKEDIRLLKIFNMLSVT